MARPRKLTDEQIEQVMRDYREGVPTVETAETLGVDKATVRRYRYRLADPEYDSNKVANARRRADSVANAHRRVDAK